MPDKPNPYEDAAAVLLKESGCTVREYRRNNTGKAFTRSKDWGIIVPRPRGPISFGVFAHEVGHQMLHRFNSTPRWLEELEAWEYALEQFDRFELDGKEKSRQDAAASLVWAAAKANKRGSAETARKILDRYPAWVWELGESVAPFSIDRSAVEYLDA